MCSKDILIVEDDKVILRILELELKYEGYTFDVAEDGREGLELFEKNNYKVNGKPWVHSLILQTMQ